jgi:hypothetical protein
LDTAYFVFIGIGVALAMGGLASWIEERPRNPQPGLLVTKEDGFITRVVKVELEESSDNRRHLLFWILILPWLLPYGAWMAVVGLGFVGAVVADAVTKSKPRLG